MKRRHRPRAVLYADLCACADERPRLFELAERDDLEEEMQYGMWYEHKHTRGSFKIEAKSAPGTPAPARITIVKRRRRDKVEHETIFVLAGSAWENDAVGLMALQRDVRHAAVRYAVVWGRARLRVAMETVAEKRAMRAQLKALRTVHEAAIAARDHAIERLRREIHGEGASAWGRSATGRFR